MVISVFFSTIKELKEHYNLKLETRNKQYFIVRQGTTNDLAALQKLCVDTIWTICTADYTKRQLEVWVSGIGNQQRWLEIMAQQIVFIAERVNSIVGVATLDKGNYIDLLYVHKEHQRQGIAQLLLDEIEAEAKRLKQTTLTSDVSKTAKPFFENNGFKVVTEQTLIRKGVQLVNYRMSKTF